MPDWTFDTVLSGRDVGACTLGPSEAITAPRPSSVALVLAGEASVRDRSFAPGELIVAPGREIVAGTEGCMLGTVRWDGAPPSSGARIESTVPRRFEKYESFQAQVSVRDGAADVIAPWELYRVRMVAETRERVQLHVHHVVTNLLFVPGEIGVPCGYLIVARDGRVTARLLVGGDRAIVRPGHHHHVVPFRTGEPVEMIVFNDEASRYEDVDRSDFHLVESVPWGEIEILDRPDPAPALTIVGPAPASGG